MRAVEVREILKWHEFYRQGMNCQIVHDSLHVREGWTEPLPRWIGRRSDWIRFDCGWRPVDGSPHALQYRECSFAEDAAEAGLPAHAPRKAVNLSSIKGVCFAMDTSYARGTGRHSIFPIKDPTLL